MTSASRATLRRTCLALAPRARSSASSRVRWATRITKVLLMMNAPTSSATPAKIFMKMAKKSASSLLRLAFSASSAAPVTTSRPSAPLPSRARIAAASSAWLTPEAAFTATLSTWPTRPSSRWAVSRVKSTVRLPARLSAEPKRATPTTVTSVGPAAVSTVVGSPGASPASSARLLSTTTSSSARGPRPVVSSKGFSSAASVQAMPAGAAPMLMSSMAEPSPATTWA